MVTTSGSSASELSTGVFSCRIQTRADIAFQQPLGRCLFGEDNKTLFDGIGWSTVCPKPVGVWVCERFRKGVEGQQVQGLHRPIPHGGNP